MTAGARTFAVLICSAPLLLCVSCNETQTPQSNVAQSHIEANVPSDSDFDRFLSRDLAGYFAQTFGAETRVEYALLRRGPTQTGISYPKFYAWVRIPGVNGKTQEGAVRIEAIEQKHFEVTNFLSSQQIQADPKGVSEVFPAALVSEILQRATSPMTPLNTSNFSKEH
jgi:hypothetical protein